MAKIVISALEPHTIKAFTYEPTPAQAKTIWGGDYPYWFFVMNTSDDLYIGTTRADVSMYAAGAYSTSISDGRFDSVDYSRSIHNTFVFRPLA
jgi:hypothetical protein